MANSNERDKGAAKSSGSSVARVAKGLTLDNNRYTIGEMLGDPGDEGEVHRAKLKGILDFAVKFVDPSKVVRESIETEVRLLSLLRHTHLVKIIEFGLDVPKQSQRIGVGDLFELQPWFYIVMELVPGRPIHQTWTHLDGPTLLGLLDQLLDAIEHLHQRGILHMDLKPKNILVEGSGEKGFDRNVVLIDLGFSLVVDLDKFRQHYPTTEVPDEAFVQSSEVYVASTQKYTRPDRHAMLGKKMKRQELVGWFPDHDLHALGYLVREALDSMGLARTSSIRRGLEFVSSRLLNGEYKDVSRVRLDVRKLQPGYLAPLSVPELSLVADAGTYISQASATVQVTDRIRPLIEHRFFQRLRTIPQLDFEYLLYPDTRHSRFPHSLLTFHFARLALAYLLADIQFRLAVRKEDIEAALLFALLHDVGHYPLAHMFEDLKGLPTQKNQDDRIRDDEDLFEPFIVGGGTDEIGSVIQTKLAKDRALGGWIAKEFDEDVLQAFWSIAHCSYNEKQPIDPIHRLLAGLVSSAVDLDKLAYLTSDSAMSGVRYGKGIDLHGFLRSLRVPQAISELTPLRIIGIDEKGLAATESIIMARYWMLSRVYWHHTNRGIMAAFKYVISELVQSGNLQFSRYLADTFWYSEVEAMKHLSLLFDALWAEERINPLDGLMDGRRGIYKRLITVSSRWEPELYNKMRSVRDEPYLAEVANMALGKYLPHQRLKRGTVLVDIPRKGRDLIRSKEIRVLGDPEAGGSPLERGLEETSPLIGRLSEEFLSEVKKCRLFLHPDSYSKLEESMKLDQARHELRETLSAKLTLD